MALFKMRDSWNVWRRKVNEALGGLDDPIKSENVTYDNTDSGLTATNVQSAIDEVAGDLSGLTGADVSYDGTDSGLSATNVQSAIDEVDSAIDAVKSGLVPEDITYTVGSTISAYERTKITKIGDIVICNIACRLTTDTPNSTEVLTITDTDGLPTHDVFGTGVTNGIAYVFKLAYSTGKLTIEQLESNVSVIPGNSGSFGTLVWRV